MTTEKDVAVDGGDEYAVEGTVESITYQNDENGYTVCRIDTGSELFTAVGYMPGIVNGEYVKMTGKWEKHNVYGEQFKVLSFEKGELITTAAILHYLSSRAIKGVGPSLARKIVGRFKDETLDVLENHPEYLVDISGISSKKAKQISGMENAVIQLVVSFFTVAVFVGIRQGFVISVPSDDWIWILMLGIVNTGVGCYLYFSPLAKIPVQTVAVCGYLEPLSAVVFANILLGELMTPLQVVGAVCIIGGAMIGELIRPD